MTELQPSTRTPWKMMLLSSGFLLVGFLLLWWLFDHSGWGIPVEIPDTPINLYGAGLLGLYLVVLTPMTKRMHRLQPTSSVLTLTGYSLIALALAEAAYQPLRIYPLDLDPFLWLWVYISQVVRNTFVAGILAFLIAFQIKTGKTRWTSVMVWVFLGVGYYIKWRTDG